MNWKKFFFIIGVCTIISATLFILADIFGASKMTSKLEYGGILLVAAIVIPLTIRKFVLKKNK